MSSGVDALKRIGKACDPVRVSTRPGKLIDALHREQLPIVPAAQSLVNIRWHLEWLFGNTDTLLLTLVDDPTLTCAPSRPCCG